MVQDHRPPALERATAAFASQFGGLPKWAAFAPGRVNLIGEHTDYNQGFVLPIAIDRVCAAVAAPAADASVSRIHAADLGEMAELDLRAAIQVRAPNQANGIERGSWLSYIAGVLAGFQRSHALPNLDIALASSVPVGSGLSSSAAVSVSTATLLEQVLGVSFEPTAKALLCQSAEHDFAGVPCGIMDPLVSTLGRSGHALLIDCRDNQVLQIPIPPDLSIIVGNTNIRHALAGGEYAKRRAACSAAAAKLGVRSLRDARIEMLSNPLLTDEERRCARHVITEIARTLSAAAALRASDMPAMGHLMAQSHGSLRDDYRVSCRELDILVDVACGCPGVVGARMTGGGFGGCAVVLAKSPAAAAIIPMISRGYRTACGRDATVFITTASDGVRPAAC